MDRQLAKDLYEVANPVYQSFADIKKQYIDKMVIITNEETGEYGKTTGGIVRYYGRASEAFYNKWGECLSVDEYDPVYLCSFAVNVNLLLGYPI